MSKKATWKFDFWEFRRDAIKDRSYADIAMEINNSISQVNKKVNGTTEFKVSQLMHWCTCLGLDPKKYIVDNS